MYLTLVGVQGWPGRGHAQHPDAPVAPAAPDGGSVAAPSPPAAAANTAPAQAWTLAAVTAASRERAPRVQNALATLGAARAYRALGTMPRLGNPHVGLRAMIGQPDGPAATYSILLGVPFDVSGKRSAYRSEATWVERQAEAELLVALNEARSEARSAYVEVAMAEAELKALVHNQDVAADFLSRVRARFEARAAIALDLALSERDFAESVANRARAERKLADARLMLRQALDLPARAELVVDPLGAPSLPNGVTAANVAELAVAQRREAQALAAGAERKRVAQLRIRREAIGPITVAAEGERQGVQNPQSTVGASVSAELPFVLKNQGEVAVARGEGTQLEVASALAQHQVAREAVAALERFEAVLAELSAIDGRAMPAAERALDMTNEMLEAGAVDVFRVLTARQAAFALRVRRVEVLREAWLLRVQLERAVGYEEDRP